MSEEEIIKDLKNFCVMSKKEENFTYYSEYKFCEEIAERVQGLLDLYNKEKEKNKELEHKLKNNVIPKYYIRKMKEEKIQELRNTKKPELFREILFLNKLLKVKNEE